MISNYIKVVIRSMLRNKLGYFLNIFGLSIGIAAFIFIFYYVNLELGYDNFHENENQIYRVALQEFNNGEMVAESAENFPGVGPTLKDNLPEILACTRLYNAGSKNNVVLSREEEVNSQGYKVDRFLYADSNFFKIFSFPLVKGDRNTCLSRANTVVISQSFADKMFKGSDPLGQMIVMSDDDFNKETCEVTGIFKDVPFDSHLKFDVLMSYANLSKRSIGGAERYELSWRRRDMYTYLLVKEGTDPKALEAKFPAIVDQYKPDLLMLNQKNVLSLQPLNSIHLDSHLADEAERNGQRENIYTLILAGILILIVAMVNFLNYSIARSMTRAKDFGMRKIFGAVKRDLYFQFVFEALFLNLLAILVAIGIVLFCFPYFRSLTDIESTSVYDFFFNTSFFYAVVAGLVAGMTFGGILPAFILGKFDLIAVVKGQILNFGRGLWLRRTLITFQISASIALTIVCLIVLNQINFLVNYDLGIDIADTFFVDRPGVGAKDPRDEAKNFDLFKTRLLTDPSIISVSGSSMIPGKKIRMSSPVYLYGQDKKTGHEVDLVGVDESFLSSLDLDVIAGRAFSKERQMDADTNTIISEKTAKMLGFDTPEDALGKTVTVDVWDWSPMIIGVVKDFHQLSLKENTRPTLFLYTAMLSEYYLVKFNPEQTSAALNHLERTWNATFPGNPFDYYYLKDYFNEQYSAEQVLSRYILLFAIISILISGIGLFNISLFTMVQRTKEIGVRKTLGASAFQIGWMLIKDYLKLIAIGSLIAFPLAYLFGKEWLANYVYSVPLSGWYFFLAVLIVLLISILTIGFYTEKATRIDPVQAIKNQN